MWQQVLSRGPGGFHQPQRLQVLWRERELAGDVEAALVLQPRAKRLQDAVLVGRVCQVMEGGEGQDGIEPRVSEACRASPKSQTCRL